MATSLLGFQALLCYVMFWLLSHNSDVAQALSEAQILIDFRSYIIDDQNALANWQDTVTVGVSSTQPCNWTGISCTTEGFVTGVDLSHMNLMSRSELHINLCQLPNLTSIQLQENDFSGPLPPELHNCTNLEHLNLGANNFTGTIPAEIIAPLQNLQYLNLSLNTFTGELPGAIGRLHKLQSLDLVATGLSGTLPSELGELAEIQHLVMSWNPFSPGITLPDTLTQLQQLRYFECAGCGLNGDLPLWLGRLQNLEYLDLSNNLLTGAIPASLMSLQNLKWLELYKNEITGQIPFEIWNLTSLTDLDLSDNNLTGVIPDEIARIENLAVLHLQNNSLDGPIPPAIVNLTKLYDLKLYMNKLNGTVPPALGRNSALLQFDVSNNNLQGQIPPTLCAQGVLWRLILFNNTLTGNLPESYGTCSSLIRIRIFGNRLSGTVPPALWGLPNLTLLEIHDNEFQGTIPATIATGTNISSLKIHNNKLSGPLPPELGQLKKIERLHAHHNNFSGEIPPELGNLGSSLTTLYLDSNSFSGPVPEQIITNLINLVYLGLSSNHLTGPLPPEIGNLENLIFLDVSNNSLSGDLSNAIANLNMDRFVTFNCSFNKFSGRIPATSLDLISPNWFLGNPDLCLAGSQCLGLDERRSSNSVRKFVIVVSVFLATLAIVGLAIWRMGKRGGRNEAKLASDPSGRKYFAPWSITLFHQVSVTYKEIMECLDDENVIGSGGGGEVYKATLRSGQKIAIKRLWEAGKGMGFCDNGFKAEVDTLGAIRHRNIVKLLCCCSSFTTNLLVYEYMPNGSLGDLLHGTKNNMLLDWSIRCKIAIGAAQGLAYLHHDCVPQILHRDIKSNNILLDDEYEAHIADFGLAKNLDDVSMSVVAGSYGYIAPEYAYTMNVNEKSDVYSFGVVLMELVTGRRPVCQEFGDAMDMVRWVSKQIREHGESIVTELFDKRIEDLSCCEPQMLNVFNIAVCCTQHLPNARPTMRRVTEMLLESQKVEIVKSHTV